MRVFKKNQNYIIFELSALDSLILNITNNDKKNT